jgi:streptomycin 6-kinase
VNTAFPPHRRLRRAAWVATLPVRLARLSRRWQLVATEPMPRGGTGARLFTAMAPAGPVVLKLDLPGQAVQAEAEALAGFAGQGATRLLAAAPEQGALLLERLTPGTPLATLADDDAATHAAAEVMLRLRRPAPQGALVAETAGWVRIMDRARSERWPLPRPILDRAAALFHDLAASAPAPVLLHADLHHGNILRAGEGWRAIDPRGALGDPAFEAAALLRNPAGAPAVARARRRLDILAAVLGLDRVRLAGWGYATAVLAACWAVEDAEAPASWLAATEALGPEAP